MAAAANGATPAKPPLPPHPPSSIGKTPQRHPTLDALTRAHAVQVSASPASVAAAALAWGRHGVPFVDALRLVSRLADSKDALTQDSQSLVGRHLLQPLP